MVSKKVEFSQYKLAELKNIPRPINITARTREIAKQRRNDGKEYVNSTGAIVEAKRSPLQVMYPNSIKHKNFKNFSILFDFFT